MKSVQYQPLKQPDGNVKYVRLTFIDVGHGAMDYLINYKDTNKFYIGHTNSGDDRIQGHFTHDKNNKDKPMYVYTEALKNYDIEIRMLRQCNSQSEAKYWETKFIKEYRRKLGEKLLNILD